MSTNPIQELEKTKVIKSDRVHKRRALTESEAKRLLSAAEQGGPWRGISGHERTLIYRLALQSGLRANEIRQLQRQDFNFNAMTVRVKDFTAKNRKEAFLPLKPALAEQLKAFLATKTPQAKAFNVPEKCYLMIQHDLEPAGIEYETDDGFADFHALRHTFGTMLVRAGVDVKTCMELMRHSSVSLTLELYAHSVKGQEHNAEHCKSDREGRELINGV